MQGWLHKEDPRLEEDVEAIGFDLQVLGSHGRFLRRE